MCINGVWSGVCDDGEWTHHDASVVCKQLNYTSKLGIQDYMYSNNTYNESNGTQFKYIKLIIISTCISVDKGHTYS